MELRYDKWQIDFKKCRGDKILCTGRQVGKSEECADDCTDYVNEVLKPDSKLMTKPVVMIAPTEKQAFGLFSKTLQRSTEVLGKDIMHGKDRPTQTRISYKRGKRRIDVYCLPVGPTGLSVRFLTIGRLYVDEASRMPELVWEAITPALWGDMIVLSTPHGVDTEFHKIWVNKDGAYDSFTRFSIDTEKVIRARPICESWPQAMRDRYLLKIEQAKMRMSKRQFNQEYMGEFQADLHRWYTDEWIEKICRGKRPERRNESQIHGMGVDIARMGEDTSRFSIGMRTTDKLVQVELITTRKTKTTDTENKIVELTRGWDLHKNYIDAGSGTLGVSVMDHLTDDEWLEKFCPDIDAMKDKMVAINNAKRIVEYDDDRNPVYVKLQKEDLHEYMKALGEQNRLVLLDDEDQKFELASVQYEYVQKKGQLTTLKIFANPSADIVEADIRMCQFIKYKHLKLYVKSIKV